MFAEIKALFKRDMLLGFYNARYRLLACMIIFIVIAIFSVLQLKADLALQQDDKVASNQFDLIYTIFKGVPYQSLDDPDTKFPYSWLILQTMGMFLIGNYLRHDLLAQSSILYIRIKKRMSLLVSKLLFIFVVILATYIAFVLIAILAAALFLGVSPHWSDISDMVVGVRLPDTLIFSGYVIGLSFAIHALLTMVFALLSIFIRSIYAALIILAALILSVYSRNPMLPGSYSMIERHQLMAGPEGINWIYVMIYTSCVLLFTVIISYFFFRHMDIFSKEED